MANKLPQRQIGKTGIKASALGFGCMSLSGGFYGDSVDPAQSEEVLRRALELQAPVALSTADFYTSLTSPPIRQNLTLLGKVLPDFPREAAIIAMKIGPWINPGAQPPFAKPDYSPASFRQRLDEALKVLNVSYIDVLVWRLGVGSDPNTPVEETARGLKALLDEGKVKAVGVSEATAAEMRAIHAIVPISLVELEWSLFSRDCEKEIVPLAREFGATILAYSPLGRGLLTGYDFSQLAASDVRRSHHQPRFLGEALSKNQQLALKVAEFAKKKGGTPGQVALAWVLAQGEDVIPIPGTKRTKFLEENIGALQVQLSPTEVQELAALVPEEEVTGARHNLRH